MVSRSLGRPCVVGCGDAVVELAGRVLTVDGEGAVWDGALPMTQPTADQNFWLKRLLGWAEDAGESRFARGADPAEIAGRPHE